VPHVAASIAHISPWAAMDAAIHAPAPAMPAATQPVPATGQLNQQELMQREGHRKKEHKKELMQLLEEACRQVLVHIKSRLLTLSALVHSMLRTVLYGKLCHHMISLLTEKMHTIHSDVTVLCQE